MGSTCPSTIPAMPSMLTPAYILENLGGSMHAGPCEDARGASLLGVVKLAAAPELAVPRLDEEVAGRGARPAGEGLGLLDGALLLSMQRPRSVLGMQGPVGASAGCAGAAGGTNVGSTVMQSHSGLVQGVAWPTDHMCAEQGCHCSQAA